MVGMWCQKKKAREKLARTEDRVKKGILLAIKEELYNKLFSFVKLATSAMASVELANYVKRMVDQYRARAQLTFFPPFGFSSMCRICI